MINLPSSWNDITYQQFADLQDIDTTENIFLQYINILSILTNTEPIDDIWENMDLNDLKKLISRINWITIKPSHKLLEKIDGYILKTNELLTLGEYIDLDYYFSSNCFENLPKIATIYYRHYKYDEYENIILENYDAIDINKRAIEFSNRPVLEILSLINYFNDYKKHIYNTSPLLFNPILDDEKDLDEDDLTDPEVIKELEKEKLQAEWNWVTVLHNLSNNDMTKHDMILNMPFIAILNELSYKKIFNLT